MNIKENLIITDKKGNILLLQDGADVYILVYFKQCDCTYPIPIMLPRRNPKLRYYTDIKNGKITDSFLDYINECSNLLTKDSIINWKNKNRIIAEKGKSQANKFLKLLLDKDVICSKCYLTPVTSNPQKPIQNLRDKGYVISTDRNKYCSRCNKKTTHYILTPILSNDQNNYELVSPALKYRICQVFDFRDSYTGIKNTSSKAFVPDHKFPEDRWDKDTADINNNDMSKDKIKQKFQLLTIQTNLQKQKHCAKCIKTGQRGYPFGIKYYYKGSEKWDKNIPSKGKKAEEGCVGCGWYDLLEWKKQLNHKLNGDK